MYRFGSLQQAGRFHLVDPDCIPPLAQFSFERFIAWRYLRGAQGQAEGRNFLRFITYVAVGGVAVGVAALLLALSIVRGFSQEIEAKIIGFGSHIQVRHYLPGHLLDAAGARADQLAQNEQIVAVRPVLEDFVLLRRSAESIDGVALIGVEAPPPYLRDRIVAGTFGFMPDARRRPGLVLGSRLADRLGLRVGDMVTAFSLQARTDDASVAPLQPRVKQFHVAGLYETSLANIDEMYAFTGLRSARELMAVPHDQVSRFDLSVQEPQQIDSTAARIERTMGFPIRAQTIFQQYRGLFAWVNLQQSIIPLVIGVIVLVAAFNIIGILLMMILEKTREIGVLGSLGASERQVRRLFLTLGALIGGIGVVIGELLALGLGYAQMRFDIIPLPAEAYYMTSAPVALNPLDFMVVAVIALGLSLLAAYIPARVAARIEPVQAIRFE